MKALRRTGPACAVAIALALVALDTLARPGGGHQYSGGGSSSGGGGSGGGDGGLVFFLIRILLELCIEAPAIGIPLVLAILIGFAIVAARSRSNHDWNGPSAAAVAASRSPGRSAAAKLDGIRARDPGFSGVLFEDFTYALVAAAHRARHDAKKLAELAPYLADGTRRTLAERAPVGVPVTAVIVGSLRVVSVGLATDMTHVTLEIEANLVFGAGKLGDQFVREQWTLIRGATVQSRPGGQAKTFACPNCGAPFESTDSQRCRYCGEIVSNGRFDWSVVGVRLFESGERPAGLTADVEEQGTDLPTIADPAFDDEWASLRAEDPALTDQALVARVTLIHAELNRAWNAMDPSLVRGFVSDGLFDYLGYWTEAYRAAGLRNRVDEAVVEDVEPVKLRRDAHYHALTARVFASGKDYTVDSQNRVVSGNRGKNREYSEYWTFIRAAGTRGAPKSERTCPNCGAELKVEMSGQCAYCHVKVTTGKFDWVLSKIEQDDSYAG